MKKQSMTRLAASLSLMAMAGLPSFAAAYSTSSGFTPKDLVDFLVPMGNGINVINTSQSFTGPLGMNTPGTIPGNTVYGTVGYLSPIGTSGSFVTSPESKSSTGEFIGGNSINAGPQSVTGRTGLPFDTGIALTTGLLIDSRGTTASPNNKSDTSKSWGANPSQLYSSPLLESFIAAASLNGTHDASTLSFQFTLDSDVEAFKFQYAFASEEYNNFEGQGVGDAFAFILTDLSTLTSVNLATIGSDAVTIDTVNAANNTAYFANNAFSSPSGGSQFLLEYNGIAVGYGATPLYALGVVDHTHTYQIDIAIADVGDYRYDSAVFMAAGSFQKTELPPPPPSEVPEPSTYVGALALAGLVARRLRRKA